MSGYNCYDFPSAINKFTDDELMYYYLDLEEQIEECKVEFKRRRELERSN